MKYHRGLYFDIFLSLKRKGFNFSEMGSSKVVLFSLYLRVS